jgi:hypothetical protein
MLEAAGARVHLTSRDGAVTVSSDGRSTEVEAWGPRLRRAEESAEAVPIDLDER